MQNWAKNKYPNGELVRHLLLPKPPRTWHNRTGGQLKTWATTIKAKLGHLSGQRVIGKYYFCFGEGGALFWMHTGFIT